MKPKDQTPPARAGACPTCGTPAVARFAPFCSRRCAEIDLGRWFKGTYVIPGRSDPDSGGEDT